MKKKNVLIVEDELIIAMMLEQMVNRLGHTVIGKVASGEDAVAEAKNLCPDIILMDIRLRGKMDGIEAIREIQQQMNTKVIYMTGNTDQQYKDRIENTNYHEFLVKPITKHQLSHCLDLAS